MYFALATIAGLVSVTTAATFKEGDSCGVYSANFTNDIFLGEYLVAGDKGCTLADGKEYCYCAPDLDDKNRLSPWKWQCNETKADFFGPKNGKKCPIELPLPIPDGFVSPTVKGLVVSDDLSVYRDMTLEDQLNNPVACDPAIHPTGRPGDEVCSYSTCDDGGDFSAICGCVDLSRYPGKEDMGTQWFCLKSTCSCGEEDTPSSSTGGDKSDAWKNTKVASTVGAAIAAMLMGLA